MENREEIDLSGLPELLPELVSHPASKETIDQVFEEDRIRTKAKLASFYESFEDQRRLLRLEYDHDTVYTIPPNALFKQKVKKKTRKGAESPSTEIKQDIKTEIVSVNGLEDTEKSQTQSTHFNGVPKVEFSEKSDKNEVSIRRTSRRTTSQNGSRSSSPKVNLNREVKAEPASPNRKSARGRSPNDEFDFAPTKRIRSSSRVSSPLVRFDPSPVSKNENSPPQSAVSTSAPKTRSTSVSRSDPNGTSKRDGKLQTVKNDIKPEKNTKVSKKEEKSQNDHSKRKRSESTKNDSKKESMKKPKPLKGVTGLKNLGNTCYLNTIVQVLASLKCFRVALFEVESAINCQQNEIIGIKNSDEHPNASPTHKRNPPRKKRNVNSLTKSLQKLVNELSAGKKRTVEPSYFVQAVNEQMPSFKGHEQQDVQEFFCQLLSRLNTEKEDRNYIDPNCSEEILNCVVNRMFTGAWQSEVTCSGCGNSNQNKEQFNTLPLEFPNKYHKMQATSTKSITLNHLLDFYTQSEQLGRVYNCVNCTSLLNGRARRTSVRTEAAKRITVLESPKCLFVHLKRAKYSQQLGQEKITCHVDFPQSLNLGPYMTHADKENNPEYLLRAVVVHHGKYFSSGHYTTFCWRDMENKKSNHSGWVEYNDSEVHPANIKDVLNSQAYMLLYVDRDLANEI